MTIYCEVPFLFLSCKVNANCFMCSIKGVKSVNAGIFRLGTTSKKIQ